MFWNEEAIWIYQQFISFIYHVSSVYQMIVWGMFYLLYNKITTNNTELWHGILFKYSLKSHHFSHSIEHVKIFFNVHVAIHSHKSWGWHIVIINEWINLSGTV